MKELVNQILEKGIGIGNDIVKVDMLLNHRIETGLVMKMGQSFANALAQYRPNLVLTIEASGIAMALAAAHALGDLPLVFAKKSAAKTNGNDVYETPIYSYTHGNTNMVRVAKSYLPKDSRVVIIDDFLASGAATLGLIELCKQADCEVVGVGIAVEKTFQEGHSKIEEMGIPVVALAKIDAIDNGKLTVSD